MARLPGAEQLRRTPGINGRPGGGYHSTFDRGFVPRPPNRTPSGYGRFGGGYEATLGRGFAFQPSDRYAGNFPPAGRKRQAEVTRRRGVGRYARWPRRSRPTTTLSHRSVGHSNTVAWAPAADRAQSTAVRCGPIARRRPPLRGANLAARSSRAFGGREFAGYSPKPAHSGGFHLFGGRHSSENFQGGGHAPKSFRGGRNFSSRHSGGGGHSGGDSSDKHHH